MSFPWTGLTICHNEWVEAIEDILGGISTNDILDEGVVIVFDEHFESLDFWAIRDGVLPVDYFLDKIGPSLPEWNTFQVLHSW